jgi:hypothetical protein
MGESEKKKKKRKENRSPELLHFNPKRIKNEKKKKNLSDRVRVR